MSESTANSWPKQRAWIEINLCALTANVKAIRNLLNPQTQLMAVVKADAYGHGAIAIAKTVLEAGSNWLAVATVPEGIELRQGGINAPILILGAVNSREQVQMLVKWDLQPTLVSVDQAMKIARILSSDVNDQKLAVHLKIDTGMSRLGTNWLEGAYFVSAVKKLKNFEIGSIYSHLATADETDRTVMDLQNQRWQEVLSQLDLNPEKPLFHLANSAGLLTDKNLHYDMVRAGLILYGVYPAQHLKSRIYLQPILQVKARITQIKDISPGTGVSYGHQFIAPKPMKIAIVGIGYADGVPRRLSNQMSVLINGQFVPQIGNITMDQIMIDVTDLPELQVGDVVTVLGSDGEQQILADDWANLLGTIPWEILCGFKDRLPRIING